MSLHYPLGSSPVPRAPRWVAKRERRDVKKRGKIERLYKEGLVGKERWHLPQRIPISGVASTCLNWLRMKHLYLFAHGWLIKSPEECQRDRMRERERGRKNAILNFQMATFLGESHLTKSFEGDMSIPYIRRIFHITNLQLYFPSFSPYSYPRNVDQFMHFATVISRNIHFPFFRASWQD